VSDHSHPRWSCVGIATLLAIGLGAQVALHLLEPPLAITWSYAHLWRHPELGWLGAVLAIALPAATMLVWRQPAMARSLGAVRGRRVLAGTACVLVALGVVSLRYPSHPTAIDPPLYVMAISRGEVNPRHHLTTWLLGRLAGALKGWITATTLLLAMNALYGTVTYVALAASARLLGRTRGEAMAIALLAGTAFGTVQMSFGNLTNSRSLAVALLSVFCWTAIRAVTGDGHPVWPFVIGFVGIFWYQGLVLLIPSLPVVAVEVLRRPEGRRQLATAGVVAVVAAGLATLPVYARPFAWSAFLRDAYASSICGVGDPLPSCTLPLSHIATAHHVVEVLNVWLLVDGVGILLVAVTGTWLALSLLRRRTWDPAAAVLATVAAGFFAFTITNYNPFGNFANWDVYGYGAPVTALLGGYAFVTWGRECQASSRWLLGLGLAAAAIHLLARLNTMHLDLRRHMAETPAPAAAPARTLGGASGA